MDPSLIEALILVGAIIGTSTGGLGIYWAFEKYRKSRDARRFARDFSRSNCSEYMEGPIRLIGKVKEQVQYVEAPVSGERVVGYRLLIGQKQVSKGGIAHIKVIYDEVNCVEFEIEDDMGSAVISSEVGEILIPKVGWVGYERTREQVPTEVLRRIEKDGKKFSQDIHGDIHALILEHVIGPSNVITVFGVGKNSADPEQENIGYRENPIKTTVGKDEEYKLTIWTGDSSKLPEIEGGKEILKQRCMSLDIGWSWNK